MVRNKRVSAQQILQDGAMVRILRADKSIRFEQDTLILCKTPRARGELAKSFNERRRKVTCEVGYSMLRQEMLRYGIPFDILESSGLPRLLGHFVIKDLDELYVRIGEGGLRLKRSCGEYKKYTLRWSFSFGDAYRGI